MKKLIMLVVLIVVVPVSSYGNYTDFTKGTKLAKYSLEYDKWAAGAKFGQLECDYFMGYVVGIYETNRYQYKESKRGMTVNRLCAVVSAFLKKHHDKWYYPAYTLVNLAFIDAFGFNAGATQAYIRILEGYISGLYPLHFPSEKAKP